MSDELGDRPPSSPGAAGKFYQGWIESLSPGSESGVISSAAGREIPFAFLHVRTLPRRARFDDLREGMAVGFDVGWTSAGLRVTVLELPLPREDERGPLELPEHLPPEAAQRQREQAPGGQKRKRRRRPRRRKDGPPSAGDDR